MKIGYESVPMPQKNMNYFPVNLTADTMELHRKNVLKKMKEKSWMSYLSMPTVSMAPTLLT